MNDASHIERINRRITELLGLHFSGSQHANLMRNLKLVARDLGMNPGNEAILKWLMREEIQEREMELLASHLTVSETYFFREKLALKLLLEKIIPAHLAAHSGATPRPLRIWSAGCSSGEEIYSIAITLRESFPDSKTLPLMLLGTDVNSRALEKARTGIYTPWSFRSTPDYIRNKYFTLRGKNYEISDEIKSMVLFDRLNLANDAFFSMGEELLMMDVIFCRNVLMYFSTDVIRRVARKLFESLRTDGWLITGQVEINDEYFGAFQRVLFENGIFYCKAPPEQKRKQPLKVLMPLPDKFGKRKPSAATTILKKTQVRQKTERLRQPEQGLQLAVQVSGQSSALYASATALANSGRLDEARQVMQQLVEADGAVAEHYYLYAIILMEKQDWAEADRNLVKTLYLEPMHLAARLSRTQTLKNIGRKDHARKEMQNLINDIENYDDKQTLPTLDGMTAGRLREMAGLLAGHTKI